MSDIGCKKGAQPAPLEHTNEPLAKSLRIQGETSLAEPAFGHFADHCVGGVKDIAHIVLYGLAE